MRSAPVAASSTSTVNPAGSKKQLEGELPLEDRLSLIDQAAELGARSINFVGAGEPTIEPGIFSLLERMRKHDITPIVHSEAALRLTDRGFVRSLAELDVTVVVKVNSLSNAAYQNAIIRGAGQRTSPAMERYTELRDRAIDLLLEEGFASREPTRLAFDTIICRQNLAEVPAIHRFARRHNIFVLFVSYLPSGRSSNGLHDGLSAEEHS